MSHLQCFHFPLPPINTVNSWLETIIIKIKSVGMQGRKNMFESNFSEP